VADTLKGAIIRVACQAVVLVDEAAETVAAVDRAHTRSFLWLVRVGRTTFKGTMRPLPVVMVDVDAEHAFEAASEEPEPGRAREAAHDVSAAIADSRQGPHPGFVDHVHVALELALAMPRPPLP
jgi:hypothetical protein